FPPRRPSHLADTPRLPAGLHADFLDLFRSNGLANPGALEVLGTPIDLGKVMRDAYVVEGAPDHITPWPGASQTPHFSGSERSSCSARAGTSRRSSTRPAI